MVTSSDDPSGRGVLMAEYEQIKNEQRLRIGFRDNLIYVALASMAAVVAATLNSHGHANLLLLLPPVTVLLGWTYLVNDEKVTAIGRYIRKELTPRLQALSGDTSPIFGWESVHRDDKHRISRKYFQLAVDLGTFCVPALVALVIYWISGPRTALFITISIMEVALIVALSTQMISYADLVRDTDAHA